MSHEKYTFLGFCEETKRVLYQSRDLYISQTPYVTNSTSHELNESRMLRRLWPLRKNIASNFMNHVTYTYHVIRHEFNESRTEGGPNVAPSLAIEKEYSK